ncbi:hypothetical protein K503DRAFT_736667 [Rhizopogon vinicolor AM-OR11-026]|uniref:Uncharacterized protein n=1 Tax=Rhizopogon vinicolor AM-OR11-026 TaxID=1314800 RepID=A0A1B7N7U3_9AGAM|nr:hypothetical protein K503DRAFT_736667 [Rhizopogon vinicolor AM-OR11-026]
MLSSRPLGITFDGDYRNLTKTPGRTMLKSRNALQENVGQHVHVPGTVAGKAKKAALQHTPFHPNTLQPQKTRKHHGEATKSKGKESFASSRPLGDKTPFPNRIVNHSTPLQVIQPLFDVTPSAFLRPSSARKHIRLPRSASRSFQTPVTGGNHWDVSDIDINPEVAAAPNQSIEEEDYEEIEYMPPKLTELPYEPPFELPNYKEVGKTLLTLIHSYPIEDVPPHAIFTEFTTPGSDDKFFAPDVLSLPHLDDDNPFIQPSSTPKPEPRVTRAPSSLKTAIRPLKASRAASTISHSTLATTSRLRSGLQAVSRPSSMRPGPTSNVTTSKSVTRAPSSASVPKGNTSRTPSTRAPSTYVSRAASTAVSRAPSTVAMTRMRPASALPTGVRSQAGTVTRNLGAQSKVNARSETTNNVPRVGIVFEDNWQEEEFRFSF